MKIPFTVEQFFGIFAQYNESIWPMPVVAYLLAAAGVGLVFAKAAPAGAVDRNRQSRSSDSREVSAG